MPVSLTASSQGNMGTKELVVTKYTLNAFGNVSHIEAVQNYNVTKIMEYSLTLVSFSLADSDVFMK